MLAKELGIDRTSVVRLEAGARKVSAGELAVIAEVLKRPIEWFVLESPPAVLSRRRDSVRAHATSIALDVAVDRAVRDVQFLLDRGILAWLPVGEPEAVPASHEEAEALASRMRQRLGMGDDPLLDLGAAAEQLGVITFSLDLGSADDGACVELTGPDSGRCGVVVINGNEDPGRRRWTLAHELGHFLVGDAYAGEHPAGEIERYVDSFVAYLLMPRAGALRVWSERSEQGERAATLSVSARYRTSWTAACGHLVNLGLVDRSQLDGLKREQPTIGDYLALGETWDEELRPPYVPPTYTQNVLTAYADGRLTASRSVELLRSTLATSDLPTPTQLPIESLRSAFDPLT
jgi:Zn-dependent peptidase ImmA (M78 family)